jgi:hypothetical protein|tara:strand:- start:2183 stop:3520 length:1338 start_codon:yes stop_codon:yes gene_type:complete
MNYSSKINKEFATFISCFSVFTLMFIYYDISWGLMDDYRWIELTNNFIDNPLNYVEAIRYRLNEIGMFQPFLFLQFIGQYLPGIYLGTNFFYIQNILIILIIHYWSVVTFKNSLNINYFFSLSIFLIYPYTYDMFFLPSLQEKFCFLLFLYLVNKLNTFKLFTKKEYLKIFIISLSLPLVKLQGAIFIFFIFFYYLKNKDTAVIYSLAGIVTGIALQAYSLFFLNAHYYVVNNSYENLFSNLISIQNIFFIVIILITCLATLVEKNSSATLDILGLLVSSLALIFLYINWETYGYLLSFYAFFISLFIPYVFQKLLMVLSVKINMNFFNMVLILLVFTSSYLFFLPRIERWSDVNTVYQILDNNLLENKIYYCGSEGTLTFNRLNDSKNNVVHANNLIDITENNFYFITDDMQCSYFEKSLTNTCSVNPAFQSKYKRSEIIKISC